MCFEDCRFLADNENATHPPSSRKKVHQNTHWRHYGIDNLSGYCRHVPIIDTPCALNAKQANEYTRRRRYAVSGKPRV